MNKEKNRKRNLLILGVIFVLFIVCIIFVAVFFAIIDPIYHPSGDNNMDAAWMSSVASYWGAILGGIISGLLAVIGVVWTIGYYRNSDNERICREYMPFLMVEIMKSTVERGLAVGKGEFNVYQINSKAINDLHPNEEIEHETIFYHRIGLKNIGREFAKTQAIYIDEKEINFCELIQVDYTRQFCFAIHIPARFSEDEISFSVGYLDCMGNKYTQDYCIQWKNNDFYNDENRNIQQGYPKLIKRK